MFLPLGGSSVILFPAHSRTLDRAFSSGGERFPDTEEVTSSNLVTPTKCSQLRGFASELFCFTPPSRATKPASITPTTITAKPEAVPTPTAIIPTGPQAASVLPAATPAEPKAAPTTAAITPTKPKATSAAPATSPTSPKATSAAPATSPTSPKVASTPPTIAPSGSKVAQTTLATAPIRPGWASQPHPVNLPAIRSNTFPRSERAYLDPQSIHTFWRQNRRIPTAKPQEMSRQKCRCYGGPF